MVIQQNAITSEASTSVASQTRIQFHRAALIILLIVGITILLSLYVYQASVNYTVQMRIEGKKQEYAREQRVLATKLQLLGESQSIEAMVSRAKAAGYQPPQPSQIRYVRKDGGVVLTSSDDASTVAANR